MFEKRTGEIVTDLLKEWEVDRIYGMPGDSINELIDDIRREKGEIGFVQIRHEEVGALAASSYAKLTGKLGACLSIAGPGAVHLLNGLYDAKQDGAPVLALVGQVQSTKVGTDAFQEINLPRLFDDVAVFNEQAESAEQLPDLVNKAIRSAYAQGGVAVLIIPDDLTAVKQKPNEMMTTPIARQPKMIPEQTAITNACGLLQEAKKPVIIAGRGARHAQRELVDFAEKIQAPVVLSLLGKGTLPDYHELNLGQHGQIGTKPAYEAMMDTDLLLMIGTSFPYPDFLPDKAKAIQIEIRPEKIGSYYPVTEGLCGDTKKILPMLTDLVPKKEDSSFLKKYQEKMKKWHTHMVEEKKKDSNPLHAPQVMYALEQVVDSDAVISCDVGNVTVWTTRYFPFTRQKFVTSGRLATMGIGLPGAIASQFAYPDRQVVAICGDGGLAMVMHDFITAVKYDLPIKIVVLNNSKIGMIQYEQEEMGHLSYATNLGDIQFAEFADSCGGDGYRIETQEEMHTKMQQAFLSDKPAIIDVDIEDQAPLPGNITYDQAIHFGEYLVKEFFTNGKIDFPSPGTSIRRLL